MVLFSILLRVSCKAVFINTVVSIMKACYTNKAVAYYKAVLLNLMYDTDVSCNPAFNIVVNMMQCCFYTVINMVQCCFHLYCHKYVARLLSQKLLYVSCNAAAGKLR